jgi:uncharacterized protein with PIN domain
MTRCAECNHLGFEPIAAELVASRVPAKVLDSVHDFMVCRGCDKVYWEGPKFDTACSLYLKLVEEEA